MRWLLLTAGMLLCSVCFAAKTIRLAILDTPLVTVNNIWTLSQDEEAYVNGIKVAVQQAKKAGYNVKYKVFIFSPDPKAEYAKIKAVKAWQPDVIIGPHSSNQFLLLKPFFKKIMVISPYASDMSIVKMGKNFYTLSVLDADYVRFLAYLVTKKIPVKSMLNVVDAGCKDCVDFAKLFDQQLAQKNASIKTTNTFYVGDPNKVNVKSLLKGYQRGELLDIQASTYYGSRILVHRLAGYLYGAEPKFLTILDQMMPVKLQEIAQGKGRIEYHVYSTLFKTETKLFKTYLALYQKMFNQKPSVQVSYITYLTVRSVFSALKKYPNHVGGMRAKILKSYEEAIAKNAYWFKTNKFHVDVIDNGKLDKMYLVSVLPHKVRIERVHVKSA